MKKLLLIIPFFYFAINLSGQLTEIPTEIEEPRCMALDGSNLYVSDRSADKIYVVDLGLPVPVTAEFLTGITEPTAIVLNGNDLYFCEYPVGTIFKVDITATDPIPELVISDLDGPNGLLINGNDLYICESTGDKISKIDITETDPTPVQVVSGLSFPNGMALYGNDLYIVQPTGDRLSKIDITEVNPIPMNVLTNLMTPVRSPVIMGDELYFSEYDADRIVKIDLTAASPSPTDFITGISNPASLILDDACLIIAEIGENKVLKYQFDVVATTAVAELSQIALFPNPANDYLKISSDQLFNDLQIMDINGRILKSISGTQQEIELAVDFLESGIYFIEIDHQRTLKFIKE